MRLRQLLQRVSLVLFFFPGLASAQLSGVDPLRVLPANYKLVLENAWVRVVHVRYGPHEKLPVHDHSERATVYVYLSDSPPVQFRHIEKPPFALTRPPQKAGAFRVSPGRLESHEVENLGDSESQFFRLELKQIPLGMQNLFQRGAVPAVLSTTRLAKEYVRPQLAIERVLVADHRAVSLDDAAIPSLLIAFSEARLPSAALHAGEIHWLDAGPTTTIDNADGSVAHLLRLEFPPVK